MDHSIPDPAERAPPDDDDSADAVETKAALKEMEEMGGEGEPTACYERGTFWLVRCKFVHTQRPFHIQ